MRDEMEMDCDLTDEEAESKPDEQEIIKAEVDESNEGAKKKSVYINLADTEVHGEDSDGEFQRRVPITKKVNQEEV